MKDYLLGIDFGACNIKVAWFNEANGRSKPLKIEDYDNVSDYAVPNRILYSGREDFRVGRIAERSGTQKRENLIDGIKRHLEEKNWRHEFPELGFVLSAEDVAKDIFTWIKKGVEGNGHMIEKAIVTAPVCFSEVQKKRILRCAEEAGIPVAGMLSEPAAALFSIEDIFADECDEEIVVFDFGGSTLDLCLCHAENDGNGSTNIEIRSSCGMKFGGIDITNMIRDQILYPKYRARIDEELQAGRSSLVWSELTETVDNMKQDLFEEEEEEVTSFFNTPNSSEKCLDMTLTLEEVERLFEKEKIADRIRALLDELFESADMEKESVTQVRVFGGTSRIQYFRDILEEYFPGRMTNYDSETIYAAVSMGAAAYMGLKGGSGIQVVNHVPYYIGFEKNGRLDSVIRKNARYGYRSRERMFSCECLKKDGWRIPMYQSFERDDVPIKGDMGAIYMGDLYLQESLYYGVNEIWCGFLLDGNGDVAAECLIREDDGSESVQEKTSLVIGGMINGKSE